MANATIAAATAPKVEPMVRAEAPLAGAVRAVEVATVGAVEDAVPAAVVVLPTGYGAVLMMAGPARLVVVAGTGATVGIWGWYGVVIVVIGVVDVLGVELATVAAEVAGTTDEAAETLLPPLHAIVSM